MSSIEHLVSRHHEDQKRIARNAISALHPIWQIIDFHNLRETTTPWLKAARPIVEQGFLTSRYVAAEFVKNYRNAEAPGSEPLDVEVPNPLGFLGSPLTAERKISLAMMVSLKVTGPVWLAQNSFPNMSADQIPQLMRDGFSKVSGAVIRLVLNGGRGMVRTLVEADPLAIGIARVADDDSCTTCLAMRRPIAKSNKKGMKIVSVGHDFCSCSAKPIY